MILPTISCPNDAVSPDPRGLMTRGISHDSEQPQHRYLLHNIFIEFKLNILTFWYLHLGVINQFKSYLERPEL